MKYAILALLLIISVESMANIHCWTTIDGQDTYCSEY